MHQPHFSLRSGWSRVDYDIKVLAMACLDCCSCPHHRDYWVWSRQLLSAKTCYQRGPIRRQHLLPRLFVDPLEPDHNVDSVSI